MVTFTTYTFISSYGLPYSIHDILWTECVRISYIVEFKNKSMKWQYYCALIIWSFAVELARNFVWRYLYDFTAYTIHFLLVRTMHNNFTSSSLIQISYSYWFGVRQEGLDDRNRFKVPFGHFLIKYTNSRSLHIFWVATICDTWRKNQIHFIMCRKRRVALCITVLNYL